MIVARQIIGTFGKYRKIVQIVLIAFYLVIPWLTWDGRPFVLLDIEERKFFFPGAVFWPQEFYFLLIVTLLAGITLFLFTSLFGRLWCGWACPQTVYTELFDILARLVSPRYGKASQKSWEKILVYSAWLILTLFLTFHFMAYFVGARQMIDHFIADGLNVFTTQVWPVFYISIAALVYFDLAWFRHNFCVYICPYARFQSVMLDENSIVIAYDKHRGEPRRIKKIKPGDAQEKDWGDCTGCRKCVQVCPTGIDIREGLQVACINCTHCIDACDEEMAAYNKPTLVDFASTNYFESRKKTKLLRPRTIIYSGLFVSTIIVFATMLIIRIPVYASVMRERTVQPILIGSMAQNIYEVALGNETEAKTEFEISVRLARASDQKLLTALNVLGLKQHKMEANELKKVRLVVQSEVSQTSAVISRSIPIEFVIKNLELNQSVTKKTIFTIPKKIKPDKK